LAGSDPVQPFIVVIGGLGNRRWGQAWLIAKGRNKPISQAWPLYTFPVLGIAPPLRLQGHTCIPMRGGSVGVYIVFIGFCKLGKVPSRHRGNYLSGNRWMASNQLDADAAWPLLLAEGKIDNLLAQVNTIGLHSIYCLGHRNINPFAFCMEQHSYRSR
jgi:hypothetical protein